MTTVTTAVVDGPRKRRMGSGVACLALLGLTLAALGHVAVQARKLDVALALRVALKDHHELVEQRRRLTAEIGRLKEPGRISATARDRLKMTPVEPNDIRVVGEAGVRGGGVGMVGKGSRLQAAGSGSNAPERAGPGPANRPATESSR